jgi:hypothetical protein
MIIGVTGLYVSNPAALVEVAKDAPNVFHWSEAKATIELRSNP